MSRGADHRPWQARFAYAVAATGEDGLPIAAMTPADGAAADVLVAM